MNGYGQIRNVEKIYAKYITCLLYTSEWGISGSNNYDSSRKGIDVKYGRYNSDRTVSTLLTWKAVEPVSYTHLDVYKRQTKWCLLCERTSDKQDVQS